MPSDKEIKQLVDGINSLKGRGSYRELFDKYDTDDDGLIDGKELAKLLVAADVGNRFTRGAWVNGIVEAADAKLNTADQKVSWQEFQALLDGRPTAMLRRKIITMFQYA